jgi:hypothetical protein
MIDPKVLKPEDKDRLVVYRSYPEANPEQGRITSWNESFVFVDYDNTGRGQATPPSKLEFIYG